MDSPHKGLIIQKASSYDDMSVPVKSQWLTVDLHIMNVVDTDKRNNSPILTFHTVFFEIRVELS